MAIAVQVINNVRCLFPSRQTLKRNRCQTYILIMEEYSPSSANSKQFEKKVHSTIISKKRHLHHEEKIKETNLTTA
jgi:hypothetical protein